MEDAAADVEEAAADEEDATAGEEDAAADEEDAAEEIVVAGGRTPDSVRKDSLLLSLLPVSPFPRGLYLGSALPPTSAPFVIVSASTRCRASASASDVTGILRLHLAVMVSSPEPSLESSDSGLEISSESGLEIKLM